MAEEGDRLSKEVDTLRTLRDELRVQLNLAGKEARDLFDSAEKSWRKLEGRMRRLEHESKKEAHGVADAARALAKEIREAYSRLRELV